MKQQSKSKTVSPIELERKETMLKMLFWVLAVVLTLELIFFIYVSLTDGLTPLIAVPLALSPILVLLYQKRKTVQKEIREKG